MLTLLDLSAAFDNRPRHSAAALNSSYGFRGCVLAWFTSYVDGRTRFVRCGAFKSVPTVVLCGVPQGSVIGPILFLLYTFDLVQLIQGYDLRPHLYADDIQIIHVIRRRQPFFERRCLRVWTTSHRGCAAIDSSSTPRRLRCCGVRRAVGNIRSHRKPHASATILSRLPAGYATWASTWIPRLP